MNFVWGLITGIGVATAACLIWFKMKKKDMPIQAGEVEKANFNPNPNVEIRRENLAKLEDLISKQDKVTNDEVQEFLKVSDKTATRYLDELEAQGKLKQIGGAQKDTYYEITRSKATYYEKTSSIG